jgi:hypothetical protein
VLRSPRQDLVWPANIELEEKLSEPMAMTKLISLRSVTCSNKIPQGLLLGIGNPDRR